jgi:hypothetical protein
MLPGEELALVVVLLLPGYYLVVEYEAAERSQGKGKVLALEMVRVIGHHFLQQVDVVAMVVVVR